MTDNSPIRTCIDKIENRIIFRIKTGYYLEFLTLEKMKLLGTTKSKIKKIKKAKICLIYRRTEVALVHCNIVNNHHQKDWRILYTFVPEKSFGQLLDISPKTFIFLKNFNSELSYI